MSAAATTRTCPICTAELEPAQHEGVEIDRCAAGHGIWLDRGELPQVVSSEAARREPHEQAEAVVAAAQDAGHAVVAEAAAPRRACPVCSAQMQLTEYARSGIAIDECRYHGIWLDAGELERIEAYAEGIRAQARPGAASGMTVKGIDIPADLLATIRTASVPPPPPGS